MIAANTTVMIMFVIISVRIGTPTRYCHFQDVVEKVPDMSFGMPIYVKSALIITMRMPKLMKIAQKSLIMMLPFIAVMFLYLSNAEVLRSKTFSIVLMKEMIHEMEM